MEGWTDIRTHGEMELDRNRETKTRGDLGTRDARASGGTTEADGHSGRDRGRQTLGEMSRETCGERGGKEQTGGMEARGRQGMGGWKEDKTGLRLRR